MDTVTATPNEAESYKLQFVQAHMSTYLLIMEYLQRRRIHWAYLQYSERQQHARYLLHLIDIKQKSYISLYATFVFACLHSWPIYIACLGVGYEPTHSCIDFTEAGLN